MDLKINRKGFSHQNQNMMNEFMFRLNMKRDKESKKKHRQGVETLTQV